MRPRPGSARWPAGPRRSPPTPVARRGLVGCAPAPLASIVVFTGVPGAARPALEYRYHWPVRSCSDDLGGGRADQRSAGRPAPGRTGRPWCPAGTERPSSRSTRAVSVPTDPETAGAMLSNSRIWIVPDDQARDPGAGGAAAGHSELGLSSDQLQEPRGGRGLDLAHDLVRVEVRSPWRMRGGRGRMGEPAGAHADLVDQRRLRQRPARPSRAAPPGAGWWSARPVGQPGSEPGHDHGRSPEDLPGSVHPPQREAALVAPGGPPRPRFTIALNSAVRRHRRAG